MGVQSATFWELEDRGYNFEFLAPERKAQLDNFLSLPIEVDSAHLTSHELRMKKRANRDGSSRGSSAAIDTDNVSPPWKEASNDLMTPGSTPSSLFANGQRKRRGTAGSAGHTPGATPGTVNQLTAGSTPGSIPGSANSGESLVP